MIQQLLVAAGGIGSRMSDSVNPQKSKSLIKYEGKPMIQYLLESARESGFQEFFISVNDHNKEEIESIAQLVGLPFKTRLTAETYRGVPGLFIDEIKEKIVIACGHHFIPPAHFHVLQDASERFDAVFSAYTDPPNSYGKNKRILAYDIGRNVRFKMVEIGVDNIPSPHIYTRTPYIVTRDMIKQVKNDGLKKAVGYYAYKHWENGGKVTAIDSIMPPEFDFDNEFERTIRFMDRYFGSSK